MHNERKFKIHKVASESQPDIKNLIFKSLLLKVLNALCKKDKIHKISLSIVEV